MLVVLTARTMKVGSGCNDSVSDGDASAGNWYLNSAIHSLYGDLSDAADMVDGTVDCNGTIILHIYRAYWIQLVIVNDPTIYLARGRVYEFVMQQGGTHPFHIQSTVLVLTMQVHLYTHGVTPDNPLAQHQE